MAYIIKRIKISEMDEEPVPLIAAEWTVDDENDIAQVRAILLEQGVSLELNANLKGLPPFKYFQVSEGVELDPKHYTDQIPHDTATLGEVYFVISGREPEKSFRDSILKANEPLLRTPSGAPTIDVPSSDVTSPPFFSSNVLQPIGKFFERPVPKFLTHPAIGKFFERPVPRFLTHPGTLTFVALVALAIGIAVPPVGAAALVVVALASLAATVLALVPYVKRYLDKLATEADEKREINYDDEGKKPIRLAPGKGFDDSLPGKFAAFLAEHHWPRAAAGVLNLREWGNEHPAQAFFVAVGVGSLVAAVVLTAGFFTGGGAVAAVGGGALVATGGGVFAFMAPVFTTIVAPFAAAAAVAGVAATEVALAAAALVGTAFILAPLSFANTSKRFLRFLDSFRDRGDGHSDDYIDVDKEEVLQPLGSIQEPGHRSVSPFIYWGQVFTGVRKELGQALGIEKFSALEGVEAMLIEKNNKNNKNNQ